MEQKNGLSNDKELELRLVEAYNQHRSAHLGRVSAGLTSIGVGEALLARKNPYLGTADTIRPNAAFALLGGSLTVIYAYSRAIRELKELHSKYVQGRKT